jgi:hypothetical protein
MSPDDTPSTAAQQVEYRDITDFPGYRVGDDGSVWSRWQRSGSRWILGNDWYWLMPISTGRNAYFRSDYVRFAVRLFREGKSHRFYIHHLVLNAFLGPCPPGMECCHNDGNATNNRVGNLRWDVRQGNAEDMVRHGRGNQVLTPEDVVQIRKEHSQGVALKALARTFRVSVPTIRDVVRRITWKHVP